MEQTQRLSGLYRVTEVHSHARLYRNSSTNSDGSAKYVDPDRQGSRFGTGGGTTLRQGNTTFQFGPQRSFDQRYNNDRMFDPLGRPGESDNR